MDSDSAHFFKLDCLFRYSLTFPHFEIFQSPGTEKSKNHSLMKYKKKNTNISQRLSYSLLRSTSSLARNPRALQSGTIIAHRMSKNVDFSEMENTNNRAPDGTHTKNFQIIQILFGLHPTLIICYIIYLRRGIGICHSYLSYSTVQRVLRYRVCAARLP